MRDFSWKFAYMSRDCEKEKMNNQVMAGKSVALKSYKFQYNDLILWLSMRSAHVCEALCQLKVICVSADYLDCILLTSKNNDGLFIYLLRF